MPHNERLIRTLVILGICCALVYLGKFVFEIAQSLSDLILLLGIAWLIAYILGPIAQWLNQGPIPQKVTGWVRKRWGERPAERLEAFRIPYSLAAALLYLLVLLSLVLATVLITPRIIKQLGQLANRLPEYTQQAPAWWESIQDEIVQRFNVDRELLLKVDPVEGLVERAASALPDALGDAVTVVQRIAGGVANTLLVLILSLYIMLDGQRLSKQVYRVVPLRFQDELQFVFSTVDRTFGGFLRGQVLMALIQGVFTGVVMQILGLQFAITMATLSAFVMFIPELGAPIALIVPTLASAWQGSSATIPLFVTLFVFQQILLRIVIPRIMSKAIGMPSLLVLVSVLVSTRLMGFWGFFFGIPVAGALYIIVVVTLEEVKQTVDARDKQERPIDNTE